jgi:hypothetical protein
MYGGGKAASSHHHCMHNGYVLSLKNRINGKFPLCGALGFFLYRIVLVIYLLTVSPENP